MQKILFIFLIVFSFTVSFPQDINQTIHDEDSGKPMLIGTCNRAAFSDTSFFWWFNSGYNLYKPDSVAVSGIKKDLKNIRTTIVMGTWCSDSREQVPHYFKVMDEAGYTEDSLNIICVDREKKDLSGEVDSLNIELVPTFISYRDDKEIGRIIETPEQTIEEDIYSMLKNSTE
jgi:thiol-disulfide isomerase/thioredoxin